MSFFFQWGLRSAAAAYVEDPSQLFFGGTTDTEVTGTNLKLRADALEQMTGFKFKGGVVGKLTLVIPGGLVNLLRFGFTSPPRLELQDVFLLLGAIPLPRTDRDAQKKALDAVTAGLTAALTMNSSIYGLRIAGFISQMQQDAGAAAAAAGGGAASAGLAARLTAEGKRLAQVELRNVHLRYEDPSLSSGAFALGVTLRRFTTAEASSGAADLGGGLEAPPQLGPAVEGIMYRNALLEDLGAYLDDVPLRGGNLDAPEWHSVLVARSFEQWQAAMRAGIQGSSGGGSGGGGGAPPHSFLLQPFTTKARIAFNDDMKVAGQPFLNLSLRSDLGLCLSQFQLRALHALQAFLGKRDAIVESLLRLPPEDTAWWETTDGTISATKALLMGWAPSPSRLSAVKAAQNASTAAIAAATEAAAAAAAAGAAPEAAAALKAKLRAAKWFPRGVKGRLDLARAEFNAKLAHRRAMRAMLRGVALSLLRDRAERVMKACFPGRPRVVPALGLLSDDARALLSALAGLQPQSGARAGAARRFDYGRMLASRRAVRDAYIEKYSNWVVLEGQAHQRALLDGSEFKGPDFSEALSGKLPSFPKADAELVREREAAHPHFQVMAWRDVARARAELALERKGWPAAGGGGGWSLFGGGGPKLAAPEALFADAKGAALGAKGRDRIVELNSVSVLARNDATYMKALVELGSGSSFTVVERGGGAPRDALRAFFGGSLVYEKTYGKSFSAALKVKRFNVEDAASERSAHRSIIKPLTGYAGGGGGGGGSGRSGPRELPAGAEDPPVVELRLRASPPDRPDLDMDVVVSARPLLVTFAPEPLRALARLGAHVEEGTVSKGVSAVATRAYSDAYDSLAAAARVQLDVTIAAPVLLLPADLADASDGALALMLSLGSLHVTSSSFAAEADARAPQGAPAAVGARLRRCLSDSANYQTWRLQVEHVSATMVRGYHGEADAASIERATRQHVVEPVCLDIALQSCIQPTERVTTQLRVYGVLPALTVALSPAFARHLAILEGQVGGLIHGMAADAARMAVAAEAVSDGSPFNPFPREPPTSPLPPPPSPKPLQQQLEPATPRTRARASAAAAAATSTAAGMVCFSVGKVAVALHGVRQSAVLMVKRSRAEAATPCVGGSPLALPSFAASIACDPLGAPDVEFSLLNMALEAAQGETSWGDVSLGELQVRDNYALQTAKRWGGSDPSWQGTSCVEHFASSTHVPGIITSYHTRREHELEESLLDAESGVSTAPSVPLVLVRAEQSPAGTRVYAALHHLHVGFNPGTVAGLKLFAEYLSAMAVEHKASLPPQEVVASPKAGAGFPAAAQDAEGAGSKGGGGAGGSGDGGGAVGAGGGGGGGGGGSGSGQLASLDALLTLPWTAGAKKTFKGMDERLTADGHALHAQFFEVLADIGSLTLSLHMEQKRETVAALAVRGLAVGLRSAGGQSLIKAQLDDLLLLDGSTAPTAYPALLEKEKDAGRAEGAAMVDVNLRTFAPGTNNGVSTEIEANLAAIRYVHLHASLMGVIDYLSHGVAGSLATSTASIAGEKLKEAHQATPLKRLEVSLKSVKAEVPQSRTSERKLVAYISDLKLRNKIVFPEADDEAGCTRDILTVALGKLGVDVHRGGGEAAPVHLLEPATLEVMMLTDVNAGDDADNSISVDVKQPLVMDVVDTSVMVLQELLVGNIQQNPLFKPDTSLFPFFAGKTAAFVATTVRFTDVSQRGRFPPLEALAPWKTLALVINNASTLGGLAPDELNLEDIAEAAPQTLTPESSSGGGSSGNGGAADGGGRGGGGVALPPLPSGPGPRQTYNISTPGVELALVSRATLPLDSPKSGELVRLRIGKITASYSNRAEEDDTAGQVAALTVESILLFAYLPDARRTQFLKTGLEKLPAAPGRLGRPGLCVEVRSSPCGALWDAEIGLQLDFELREERGGYAAREALRRARDTALPAGGAPGASNKLTPIISGLWPIDVSVKQFHAAEEGHAPCLEAAVGSAKGLQLAVSDCVLSTVFLDLEVWQPELMACLARMQEKPAGAAPAEEACSGQLELHAAGGVASTSLARPSTLLAEVFGDGGAPLTPLRLLRTMSVDVKLPLVCLDLCRGFIGDPDGKDGPQDADAVVLVRLAVAGLRASHAAGQLQLAAGGGGTFATAAATAATHVVLDGLHILDAWWLRSDAALENAGGVLGSGGAAPLPADRPFFAMLATSLPGSERDVATALLGGHSELTPAAPVKIDALEQRLKTQGAAPFFNVLLHSVEKDSSPKLLRSAVAPLALVDWAGLRARLPQASPAGEALARGAPHATSFTAVQLSSPLALSFNADTVHQLLVWTSTAMAPQKPASVAGGEAPAAATAVVATAAAAAAAASPAPPAPPVTVSDTSLLTVTAVSISLDMVKEALRRCVARLALKDLDVALSSGGGAPSMISVRLGDLTVEDCCTVGMQHKKLVCRDKVLAAPGTPFVSVAITNRPPGATEGENSLVVEVAPARITYLAQQINEILDYLQNGVVKVLGAPPPPLPPEVLNATSYPTADDPEVRSSFSRMSVRVAPGTSILLPVSATRKDGLLLTLGADSRGLEVRTELRDLPLARGEAGGALAAASVMSVDLFSLVLTEFPPSHAGGEALNLPTLGVRIASWVHPCAREQLGGELSVEAPPLALTLLPSTVRCLLGFLSHNLGAPSPLMASEAAECIGEKARVDTDVKAFAPNSRACELCKKAFQGTTRSPHYCKVCGATVCLPCVAGKIWVAEELKAKQACVRCVGELADTERRPGAEQRLGALAAEAAAGEAAAEPAAGGARFSQRSMSTASGGGGGGGDTPQLHAAPTFEYGTVTRPSGAPSLIAVSLPLLTVRLMRDQENGGALGVVEAAGLSVSIRKDPLKLELGENSGRSILTVGVLALRVADLRRDAERSDAASSGPHAILAPRLGALGWRAGGGGTPTPHLLLTKTDRAAGGSSRVEVRLSHCDVFPNLAFFASAGAWWASSADDAGGGAPTPAADGATRGSGGGGGGGGAHPRRGARNLRPVAPVTEMEVDVRIEGVRVFLVDGSTGEGALPALLARVNVSVDGSLVTNDVQELVVSHVEHSDDVVAAAAPKPNAPLPLLPNSPLPDNAVPSRTPAPPPPPPPAPSGWAPVPASAYASGLLARARVQRVVTKLRASLWGVSVGVATVSRSAVCGVRGSLRTGGGTTPAPPGAVPGGAPRATAPAAPLPPSALLSALYDLATAQFPGVDAGALLPTGERAALRRAFGALDLEFDEAEGGAQYVENVGLDAAYEQDDTLVIGIDYDTLMDPSGALLLPGDARAPRRRKGRAVPLIDGARTFAVGPLPCERRDVRVDLLPLFLEVSAEQLALALSIVTAWSGTAGAPPPAEPAGAAPLALAAPEAPPLPDQGASPAPQSAKAATPSTAKPSRPWGEVAEEGAEGAEKDYSKLISKRPEGWHLHDYEVLFPRGAFAAPHSPQPPPLPLNFFECGEDLDGFPYRVALLADGVRSATSTAAGVVCDVGDGALQPRERGLFVRAFQHGLMAPGDVVVAVDGELVGSPGGGGRPKASGAAGNVWTAANDDEAELARLMRLAAKSAQAPVAVRFRRMPLSIAVAKKKMEKNPPPSGSGDDGAPANLLELRLLDGATGSRAPRALLRFGFASLSLRFSGDLAGGFTEMGLIPVDRLRQNAAGKFDLVVAPASGGDGGGGGDGRVLVEDAAVVAFPRGRQQIMGARRALLTALARRPAGASLTAWFELEGAFADVMHPLVDEWEPLLEPLQATAVACMLDTLSSGSGVRRRPLQQASLVVSSLHFTVTPRMLPTLSAAVERLGALSTAAAAQNAHASLAYAHGVTLGITRVTKLPPASFPFLVRNETGVDLALVFVSKRLCAGDAAGVVSSAAVQSKTVAAPLGAAVAGDAPVAAPLLSAAAALGGGGGVLLPLLPAGCSLGFAAEVGAAGSRGKPVAEPSVEFMVHRAGHEAEDVAGGEPWSGPLAVDQSRPMNFRPLSTRGSGDGRASVASVVALCLPSATRAGQTVLTLRSPLLVVNRTPARLELWALLPDTDNPGALLPTPLGTVGPGGRFPVPLHVAEVAAGVWARPAGAVAYCPPCCPNSPEGCERAGGVPLARSGRPPSGELRVDAPRGAGAPPFFALWRLFDMHSRMARALVLYAPLTLTNLLPFPAEFEVASLPKVGGPAGGVGPLLGVPTFSGALEPGASAPVLHASRGATRADGLGGTLPFLRVRPAGLNWSPWALLAPGVCGCAGHACERSTCERGREGTVTARCGTGADDAKGSASGGWLRAPLQLQVGAQLCAPSLRGALAPDFDTAAAAAAKKAAVGADAWLAVEIHASHWLFNCTALPITLGQSHGDGPPVRVVSWGEAGGAGGGGDSAAAAAAAAPAAPAPVTVETYERERFHVFAWGDPLPTEGPRFARAREAFDNELPKGWAWEGGWTSGEWDYANQMEGALGAFRPDRKPHTAFSFGDIVRQRRWTRTRAVAPQAVGGGRGGGGSGGGGASPAAPSKRAPGLLFGAALATVRSPQKKALTAQTMGVPLGGACFAAGGPPLPAAVSPEKRGDPWWVCLGSGAWCLKKLLVDAPEGARGEEAEGAAPPPATTVLELLGPAEAGAGGGALTARYDVLAVSAPCARPFHRTQRLAFVPRYTLVNASATILWWRQAGAVPVTLMPGWGAGGTAPPVMVPPFSSAPVYWPFDGGARAIQISPADCRGGWSAPIPLDLPSGRSAVAKPVLVPHGAADADCAAMVHTVAGPALVGASVWGARLRAARAGGEATVLTLAPESAPEAPLRPPPDVLLASPRDTETMRKAMEADARAEGATRAGASDLQQLPQVAFVNHSRWTVALRQRGGGPAAREDGVPLSDGDAAAEMKRYQAGAAAAAAGVRAPAGAPTGLPPASPAGIALKSAVTFAPAGATVPLGLACPASPSIKFGARLVSDAAHIGEEVIVDCATVDERWPLFAPGNRAAVVLVLRLTRAGLRIIAMDDDAGGTDAAAAAAAAPQWERLCGENEASDVEAGTRVRFGVPGKWRERVVSGPFKATNDFFGGDPAYGVQKWVERLRAGAGGGGGHQHLTPAAGGAWLVVGYEFEEFSRGFPAGTRLRFGVAGVGWVEKVLDSDGPFRASLAFFGADPAKGHKKAVEKFLPGVVATGTLSQGEELEAEGLADALQYGVGVDAVASGWEARRRRLRGGDKPPAPRPTHFSARVWDSLRTATLRGLSVSLVGDTEELLHASLAEVRLCAMATPARHTAHLTVDRLQLDDQGHAAAAQCPVVVHSGSGGRPFLSLGADTLPRGDGTGAGAGGGAALQGLHVLSANLAMDKIRFHLTHSFISRTLETVTAIGDSERASAVAAAAAAAAAATGSGVFSADELILLVSTKEEDAEESGGGGGAPPASAPFDPARAVRDALLDPPPPPARNGDAPYSSREVALGLTQGGEGSVPLGSAEVFLTSAQASPLQLQMDYTPPSYKPTRGDPLHDFLKTALVGYVPMFIARTIRNVVESMSLQGAAVCVAIPGTTAPGRFLSLAALASELQAEAGAQVPQQWRDILFAAAGAGRRVNAMQATAKGAGDAFARGDALGVVGGGAKTAVNAVGAAVETGTGALSTALGAAALGLSRAQDAIRVGPKKADGKLGAHDVTAAAGGGGGLEGAGMGLLTGVGQVGKGFYKGLKGVFVDPIKGAQQEGVAGFFKGVGTGVAGVVVRPMAGIIGGLATGVNAVHNAVHQGFDAIGVDRAAEDDVPDRVRPPRALYSPQRADASAGGGGGDGGGSGGGGGAPLLPPAARAVVKPYDDFHAKVLIALVQLAQTNHDRELGAALAEPLVAVAGGAGGTAPFRDGSTVLLTTGHLVHFSGGEREPLSLCSLLPLVAVASAEVMGGRSAGATLSVVVRRREEASGPHVELLFANTDGKGLRAAEGLQAAIIKHAKALPKK
jgi:hypothetical protein